MVLVKRWARNFPWISCESKFNFIFTFLVYFRAIAMYINNFRIIILWSQKGPSLESCNICFKFLCEFCFALKVSYLRIWFHEDFNVTLYVRSFFGRIVKKANFFVSRYFMISLSFEYNFSPFNSYLVFSHWYIYIRCLKNFLVIGFTYCQILNINVNDIFFAL